MPNAMRARHARRGVVPAGGKKKRGEVEVLRGLGDRPMVTRCETCRFRDRGPGGGSERESRGTVTGLGEVGGGGGFTQGGVPVWRGRARQIFGQLENTEEQDGGRRYRVPRSCSTA